MARTRVCLSLTYQSIQNKQPVFLLDPVNASAVFQWQTIKKPPVLHFVTRIASRLAVQFEPEPLRDVTIAHRCLHDTDVSWREIEETSPRLARKSPYNLVTPIM